MRNIFMAAASILVTSMATASAADLPARTYTKAPIASPAFNWSGFYVGVQGGYAWSNDVTVGVAGVGNVTTSSNALKGGFGGGTIGYNWQAPGSQFVFGIEVDAAGASLRYSENFFGGTLTDKIDAFGTVTGRLGLAFDRSLIYAKGGYAWGDNKFTVVGLGGSVSDSKIHSGYTVGGGWEYAFAPAWSAKVEYQYIDLSNEDYFGGLRLGTSLHTVKAGINYRLGGF